MPEQLEPKEMPECLVYLWGWFCRLNNRRKYGEGGPYPIEYQEIESWARMRMLDITVWELDVVEELDRVFLKETMKK